jgi:hypothetical protein
VAFKAIILFKRRDDIPPDVFRRWWLEHHRPLALQRKHAVSAAA